VATASGVVLLYVAGRYRSYRAASPRTLVEVAEGSGAGGYVAVGIAMLIAGGAFLENVVRLGVPGTLSSGGMIPLLNAAAGLAVAAGLVLLFHEFLEELTDPRSRGGRIDEP
jgi:multicomponent Na+:H+ antiporter subunit B